MVEQPSRIGGLDEARQRFQAIGRSGLAWEWLRRNPDYRASASAVRPHGRQDCRDLVIASSDQRARWDCLTIEAADRLPSAARLLWSREVDPEVLEADAIPAGRGQPDVLDFGRWSSIMTVVRGNDRDHVLIGQGPSAIRFDIRSGSVAMGPVVLRYYMGSERQIAALRRFLQLCRTGHLPSVAQPFSRRYHRALSALLVHDALCEGASIRDVGILLYGAARVQAEWVAPGESLKSSCRRLIALARFLVAGGYKRLFR